VAVAGVRVMVPVGVGVLDAGVLDALPGGVGVVVGVLVPGAGLVPEAVGEGVAVWVVNGVRVRVAVAVLVGVRVSVGVRVGLGLKISAIKVSIGELGELGSLG